MMDFATGRTAIVAAVVCVGLAAAAALSVQASASGSASTPDAGRVAPGATAPPPPRTDTTTTATNAACGDTITQNLTLNGDLLCSGDGLTVSGTGVVLSLNGHQISGNSAGSSTGVRLTGASETVRNGLVTSFGNGLWVTGTSDTVLTMRSTYNTSEGILDYGQSTKITNSVVYSSASDGIYSIANNPTYTGVHELSNGGDGLLLGGGGAQNATVTSNVADGNAVYGIFDFDVHTTLTKNTANFNGRDGIYVDETAAVDGGGNLAKGNGYASGGSPEQCYNIVCR